MTIRGILHIHSSYSYDGQESLDRIKSELIARGISFACITEHVDELSEEQAQKMIQECRRLSDDSILLIPGFEVPYLGTHIIVIGVSSYGYTDAQAAIERWVGAGAVAIVAHPHRNDFTSDDFMLDHTIGSEIWNSQYDGKWAPRPSALAWFKKLRAKKSSYYAFGSVDLHRLHHLGGPELVIDSERTEPAILSAMREGRFVIQRGDIRINPSGDASSDLFVLGSASVAFVTLGKAGSRLLRILGIHRLFGGLRNTVRKHL